MSPSIPTIKISRKAAAALRTGHPWLIGERVPYSPGTIVELVCDGVNVAWGFADEGRITARVLGRGSAPKQAVGKVISERVRRADGVRTRLMGPETTAYRVVSSAGDGLPDLIIDRYDSIAIIRLYSAAWEDYLDDIVRALKGLYWCSHVGRRLGVARVDGQEGLQSLTGERIPDEVLVSEHGMRLLVRPHVGQKTGLFLDQREHRALVRGWASGRLVANLFAYNGGFSVAAALGGASRVTTVDIAPDAVADAKEIFRLNGIDPDYHAFEVADVFAWKPTSSTDFVIVDPPAMTRGKHADGAAKNAYRKLHRMVSPWIPRDGLLASSSCTSRLSLEEWQGLVGATVNEFGEWSWHHVSVQPPDHAVAVGHHEAQYLKFALLRRR